MSYIIGKNLLEKHVRIKQKPAIFHDAPCFLREGALGRAPLRAKQAA